MRAVRHKQHAVYYALALTVRQLLSGVLMQVEEPAGSTAANTSAV